MAVTDAAPAWPVPQAARPLFLLSHAEPADVLALVPEGPPQRFRWRGVMHDVTHAQGPERIASEWWRSSQPTRDYYLVEDDDGRRFWLYREGLYERETNSPRWFVHGLFA
jgi:protein ImuB